MMQKSVIILLTFVFVSLSLAQYNSFVVGEDAEVNVTDPDGLSVREGPGTDHAILERLADGTIVIIMSGPVENSGYTWWQIQTPSDNQGWVVEAADGIQTLLPIANPSTSEFPEPLISNYSLNFTATYISWSPDDKYLAIANEIELATESSERLFATDIVILDSKAGFVEDIIPINDSPYHVEYIQWSEDKQFLGVMNDTFSIININDGSITETQEPEWVSEPELRLKNCCPPNPLNNLTDMVLERDGLTVQAGDPANLISSELNIPLGNSTGGIAWRRGGERVLLWSDSYSNRNTSCLAEVWSLSGELLLQVPHCSYFTDLGTNQFFAPALSHDENRLATWTMDIGGDGWVTSTLSIYQVSEH